MNFRSNQVNIVAVSFRDYVAKRPKLGAIAVQQQPQHDGLARSVEARQEISVASMIGMIRWAVGLRLFPSAYLQAEVEKSFFGESSRS